MKFEHVPKFDADRDFKRGTVFLHNVWLNEFNEPLKCVVTKVDHEMITWKDYHSTGKARYCFLKADVHMRVREIVK
jgi:hypothetical protein